MKTSRTAFGMMTGMGLLMACSAPADEATDEALSLHLESRFADLRDIRTDQLVRVAAGFATDKLNDTLVVGGNSVAFEPTQVFALREEQNSLLPAGAKVKSVEAIATGLATQYGDRELPTEVNRLRQKRLSSGAVKYFVESAFTVKAGIDHG